MEAIVSVLTPSIPSRAKLLRECRLSVEAQTEPDGVVEHLVLVDDELKGCSWAMNQLAVRAHGDWLIPLADDDLLLPGCVERLLERSSEGEIVFSPPLVIGNGSQHFFGTPPEIPSFGLIRADLWRQLGGYKQGISREEDRDFWTRALEAGATFVKIEEPVWIYRFHQASDGRYANKSYRGGRAA